MVAKGSANPRQGAFSLFAEGRGVPGWLRLYTCSHSDFHLPAAEFLQNRKSCKGLVAVEGFQVQANSSVSFAITNSPVQKTRESCLHRTPRKTGNSDYSSGSFSIGACAL